MLTLAGRLWRRSDMAYRGNTTDGSRSRAYNVRDDFVGGAMVSPSAGVNA
jgi:hypothetical protein